MDMNLNGETAISSQHRARHRPWVTAAALSALLLCALALRLLAFVGSQGTDDVMAAKCAHAVAAAPGHFFSRMDGDSGTVVRLRMGLFVPIAGVYAVLGVGYAASYVFPILTGLGNVVLAWVIGRLVLSRAAGWIAAALVAVSPLEVIHSSILFPDGPLAFYQGLAALLLLLALRTNSNTRQIVLLLACGLSAWLAWMTKEVGLGMVVFLGVATLAEFLSGRRFWRGSLILIGFVAGLVGEGLFYLAATGNPFFRFSLRLAAQKGVNLLADATQAPGYIDKMLWWWGNLARPNGLADWVLPIGVVVALIYVLKSDRWRRILALWFLTGLVFFLISLLLTYSYAPRRFLVLTMPAALLVADAVVRLATTRLRKVAAATLGLWYLATVAGSIHAQHQFHRGRQDNERRAHQFIKSLAGDHVFHTDHRTILADYFFNGLKLDERVFPIPYRRAIIKAENIPVYSSQISYLRQMGWMSRDDADRYKAAMRAYDPLTDVGAYVLLNWHYLRWQVEKRLFVWPDYVYAPPLNWRLLEIYQSPHGRDALQIFQVTSPDEPAWSPAAQADLLNLAFRRSGNSPLPDGWNLVWPGEENRPTYDVLVADPNSQANLVRLQSPQDQHRRQYFFTGRGGFTSPPGPVSDPNTPILQADRWYRLDVTARVPEQQKLSFLVFLYDASDRQSKIAVGQIDDAASMDRRVFFFRTPPGRQAVRCRIGVYLPTPGPVWLKDMELFVQEPEAGDSDT